MKKKVIIKVIKKALGALVKLNEQAEKTAAELKTLKDKVWDLEDDANNSCIDARVSDLEDVVNKRNHAAEVFVKLDPYAIKPTKSHESDAGWDLYMPHSHVTADKGAPAVIVNTGVHMMIPEGYVGLVFPRSGLASRKAVYPVTGVIDAGYTGAIGVTFPAEMLIKNKIERGDRIAQIVITPIANVQLVEVDLMPETARGDHGFGSTGK